MSRKQRVRNADNGKSKRRSSRGDVVVQQDRDIEVALELKPLVGKNENQKKAIKSIHTNEITFLTGAAGTGKTYISVSIAATMLREKKFSQIIITRPAVEAGEKLGFLPGEEKDKYAPYIEPFMDVFNIRLGKSFSELLVKRGTIKGRPMAFMRSKTFNDAFIILDEAQNTTPLQMELVLTRFGEGSKMVICGDTKQKDINGYSGLADAVIKLSDVDDIGFINFTSDDCVRSGMCKKILKAYG